MRRCENCVHARCFLAPAPGLPDIWLCKTRGDKILLFPILQALTCRAYESRYRLQIKNQEAHLAGTNFGICFIDDLSSIKTHKAVEKARLDSLQAAHSEFEKRTGYTREEK